MDSVGLLINLGILGLMTHAGIETENKVFFVSSFSYTAPTTFGIRLMFLFNVFKRFF